MTFTLAEAFAQQSVNEFRWPAENSDDWLIAFVSVETNGLAPGYHEIIDIGAVYAHLNGQEIDRFSVKIMPNHPDRTAPSAVSVNGFNIKDWKKQKAVPAREAIVALDKFHARVAQGRNVLMVSFNSQFHTSFLNELFLSQERSWNELYNYFVLDLPSMAWILGHRGLTSANLAAALGFAPEPELPEDRSGLSGALYNARLYRLLQIQRAASVIYQ